MYNYFDSDWGEGQDDEKSTPWYLFMIGALQFHGAHRNKGQ